MRKNYTRRIEQLRKRRFDELSNSFVLKSSFSDTHIGDSIRYALESMQDLPKQYTTNTLEASRKVRAHLDAGFGKKGMVAEYEHQGSVMTNTHIMVQSDIDLLVLTGEFYSVLPPAELIHPPFHGDVIDSLSGLRVACQNILKDVYTNNVDISGAYAINVQLQRPKRNVDVVIANWLDTIDWQKTQDLKFRGIHLFNYPEKKRERDFPLLHIARVNEKDTRTGGNLRKTIRLLKTLCRDADPEVSLKGFHNTSLCYAIPDNDLAVSPGMELSLLPVLEKQLGKLVNDRTYRETLKSPNETELVFGDSEEHLKSLKRLHIELAELMSDIRDDLNGFLTKTIDYQ